jgi:multiple sugar transport system permease protein
MSQNNGRGVYAVTTVSKQKHFKSNRLWLFIAPSLVGMTIFFFIPAALSLFYAFTDARGSFVWFANFADVLTSPVFQLGARNSALFIAASVPLNMTVSFLLASALRDLRHKKVLAIAFMLPLIVPSGSIVFFWNTLFADNGAVNNILLRHGLDTIPWFTTNWSFAIVLLVFLFRNIGFNLVLYMAGLSVIPKDYYDVAKIEGAGIFNTFRHVTFIYVLPTSFLVLMMSIINSFRIFREIYLLYGPYPQHSIYMLQHFMNNNFLFANMQRLSVTATALSVAVVILVAGVFWGQRKISDTFD